MVLDKIKYTGKYNNFVVKSTWSTEIFQDVLFRLSLMSFIRRSELKQQTVKIRSSAFQILLLLCLVRFPQF